MRIPAATYRVQFNSDFDFSECRKIVPYLSELGISDLYASPIFKARRGSKHGYDVVDPNQINPELGSQAMFDTLVADLQERDMGWLQDIVPNHMAYDDQNQFLMDVLEYGRDSEYFDYFDIDWEHPYEDIKGKVLTPLLGDFYSRCLEKGEIQISYDESGIRVNYYDVNIPLRIGTYAEVIAHNLDRLRQAIGRDHPDFIKLLGILYILKNVGFPDSVITSSVIDPDSQSPQTLPSEKSAKQVASEASGTVLQIQESPASATKIFNDQRRDQAIFVKSLLWELYQNNPQIKIFIDQNIAYFNGEAGNPESFDPLDNLLSEQYFRLSFWKVGAEELNYRRFFTINELISLRIEDQQVLDVTHVLITDLVTSGKITGLRIDHVDGLYDPTRYLERLREKVGDTYIVVEKILELEQEYFAKFEELPREWPIQGTSGYDFLNSVNGLFCRREHYRRLTEIYTNFTGLDTPYEELVTEKKQLIVDTNLAGDIQNLAYLLKRIARRYRYGRDFTLNGLKRAIQEVLALFPVYRTYVDLEGKLNQRDRNYVEEAIRRAKARIPQLLNELNFIERILLLDFDEILSEEEKFQWLHFALKFQQLSGPLMAKGVEDTLMYVYNRLLSLNEVGGKPSQGGISVSAFHNFCQHQKDYWPHALNATSTHDTKRSEDIRARLNVISEIPDEWEAHVKAWQKLNSVHKESVNNQVIPDANDEYFLYQTLIGAFPFADEEYDRFVGRIKEYIIKAVREAKVHTAWLQPDSDYENGYIAFTDRILQRSEDNEFLKQLHQLQSKIAFYGILNSLSQTLLNITAPGVPDFYQGTELWDLSLVDPDNRRPVDFEKRMMYLQEIKQRLQTEPLELISELMSQPQDGRLKLFLIAQALATRNQHLDVFHYGLYEPVDVEGEHKDHVLCFARRYDQTTIVVIVPRFLTDLVSPGNYPLGESVWGDTHLEVMSKMPEAWINTLTGQDLTMTETIMIGEALKHFPVALLVGRDQA